MDAKKFYFVEVNPQPDSAAEVKEHLWGLAGSFIDRTYVDRWTHTTFEKLKTRCGNLKGILIRGIAECWEYILMEATRYVR